MSTGGDSYDGFDGSASDLSDIKTDVSDIEVDSSLKGTEMIESDTGNIDTGEAIKIDDSVKSQIETSDKSIADNGLDSAAEAKPEYSENVTSYIRSEEELGVYQKAGLQEVQIGDKTALIRDDIDWDAKDEKGRTNSMRIEAGLAPLDSNGDPIELHHVGQKADSPLAELTFPEHRGKGNDTIMHDKTIESETHGEGNNWDSERQAYWQNRAEYNKQMEAKKDE